ncbi:helix-turn-helix domain-containing protein [Brevibacterium casei]|nr:helix-turn-helix transcriptional regulator [Brevibacterium casei]
MRIELPKRLERAMLDAGLVDPRTGNPSLNQWSKVSGVHTTTISNFINGRKSRPANVAKMAKALGVNQAAVYGMVGRNLHPWSPPSGTERLNARQREALNELILSFIGEPAEEDGDGDADRAATPMNDAGGKPATEEAQLASDFVESKRWQRLSRGEVADLSERQRRADETPIEKILGHAADKTGESELQRQDREAERRGEEPQD